MQKVDAIAYLETGELVAYNKGEEVDSSLSSSSYAVGERGRVNVRVSTLGVTVNGQTIRPGDAWTTGQGVVRGAFIGSTLHGAFIFTTITDENGNESTAIINEAFIGSTLNRNGAFIGSTLSRPDVEKPREAFIGST